MSRLLQFPARSPVPVESVEAAPIGGFAVLNSSRSFVLDPWIQEMEDCSRCGGLEIVIYAWEFADGRLGVCLGCGRPKQVKFTRTVGGVA